tara:strand:- start:632 stop:1333 length:702 start_codon:yes stop_codon:yes gene_type:complete
MNTSILILAGGLATRLKPVSTNIPKSLIKIKDRPFVLHQLNMLSQSGIKNVHFCLGHLGKQIEDVVRKSTFFENLNITFSYDGHKLRGTGGAIIRALSFLPAFFFVIYGDSYLDVNYKMIEKYFYQNKNSTFQNLMTVYKNDNKWDKSNIIYQNNQIKLYSKEVHSNKMKYIDYGLSILSKKTLQLYTKKSTFDLADYFLYLIRTNSLLSFEVKKRFYEIGSFKGIEEFKKKI